MMLKLSLFGAALGFAVAAGSAFAAPNPTAARGPVTTIVAPQLSLQQIHWYRGRYYRFRWGGRYYNNRRWRGGRWTYW